MLPDLPDATLRYAGHEDAVVDVHLPGGSRPTSGDTPLVVLLHGGFWKQEWDRRHTRPMARAISERGAVVATPEYRRVRGGGGWPVTGDDVLLAVRRLPELLGALGVSTGPLRVAGHSAGGQLALWLATMDLPVSPISTVVPLAPVCDLREAMRLGLGGGAAEALLGNNDAGEADPMTLLDQRPDCEVVIVHGVDDDVVPVSLSRRLVERHPWVALHEPACGHMEPVEPGSVAWATVLEALHLEVRP
jgi:acetyl esterase/lipase